MVYFSIKSFSILLLTFVFFTIHFIEVCSIEINVGGEKGWVVPPPKTDKLYNDWASKNRFKVDDTLHFEYKKDSVLVVTKEEYEKCKSTHPIFFSNNGNTTFKLDHSGLFYFISGVSGHCERGLKMIVKVLEAASPPSQSANETTTGPSTSSGPLKSPVSLSSNIVIILIVLLFGAFVM